MKVWYGEHGIHKIRVENKISNVTLYINDMVTDMDASLVSSKLTGELPSGEKVVAILGQGLTGLKCKIMVGNKIIPTIRKYKW